MIDQNLLHKTNLNEFKRIEILQNISSINNRNIAGIFSIIGNIYIYIFVDVYGSKRKFKIKYL